MTSDLKKIYDLLQAYYHKYDLDIVQATDIAIILDYMVQLSCKIKNSNLNDKDLDL